jgi:nucleoside-diphosphate-sugar epimerase
MIVLYIESLRTVGQMNNILIIGANGQIGTVLTQKLKEEYGDAHIFPTDLNAHIEKGIQALNVMDKEGLIQYITQHQIKEIYHLAAILSASGEKAPQKAWEINMGGLFNVLECSKDLGIQKVFFPSTIAVFGEHIPLQQTSNFVPLEPSTVYGISKVAGELWSKYYFEKYGLDVRSVRYPGVIGYQSLAGGGTTDYAVDIFHSAVKNETFHCFLDKDTTLPMIYMDDCIRATIELMKAPKENIKVRTSYNIAGMSFSPIEIFNEIKKHVPGFEIEYNPDFRQAIAASWPQSIDDTEARQDWNWTPQFNLEDMVKEMLHQVALKYT